MKGPDEVLAGELAGAVADEGAAGDHAVAKLLQGVEHVVGRRVELHPPVLLLGVHLLLPGGDLPQLLPRQPLHHAHAVVPPLSH